MGPLQPWTRGGRRGGAAVGPEGPAVVSAPVVTRAAFVATGETGTVAPMGLTTPLRVVVAGAGSAVDRIDRILNAIEALAVSIKSIEADMRGMRSDLREVIDGVEGLRGSVLALDGAVSGIRDATVGLETRVDDLQDTLAHVDALARSVPRVRRRAARAREASGPVNPAA